MRQIVLGVIVWLTGVTGAWAEGEPAGRFDYYVLALSWSPNWCATEGAKRRSEQCDPNKGFGWVVHGLWPQYERGWPSYCRNPARPPSRGMTKAQSDLFGSSGAAWYQWKKHGVCAGLEARDYYALVRRAYEQVNRPEVLRKLTNPVRLPAAVVEEAFLQANPDWTPDMLTITCKGDRIQEARLCLTKNLKPRVCARDVARDCRAQKALMDPVK